MAESRCVDKVWVAYRMSEYRKPVVISVHYGELEARRSAMNHFDPEADVMPVDWDESIESAYALLEAVDA